MKKILIVIALLLSISSFNTGSNLDKGATMQSGSSDDPIEVIW